MTPTAKKLLVILPLLGVLGYFGYTMFFATPSDTASLGLENGQVIGQDILTLAGKIKSLSIDQSLFSSALLLNLRDFSVPLTPEAQGRANPFAPTGI